MKIKCNFSENSLEDIANLFKNSEVSLRIFGFEGNFTKKIWRKKQNVLINVYENKNLINSGHKTTRNLLQSS